MKLLMGKFKLYANTNYMQIQIQIQIKYKLYANTNTNTKTIKATHQGKEGQNLAGKYDEANNGEGPKNIDNLAVGSQP